MSHETGITIFITHNVFESLAIVSSATQNEILPNAMSATGASDIETCTVIIHYITCHKYKLDASYSVVEFLESWKPPVGFVQKE